MINSMEEAILQYLDGTLPEKERAELLQQVAANPQHKALMDAHIKMRELFGEEKEPKPTPLYIQKSLAEKIPVLAQRLPYLVEGGNIARNTATAVTTGAASWTTRYLGSKLSIWLVAGALTTAVTFLVWNWPNSTTTPQSASPQNTTANAPIASQPGLPVDTQVARSNAENTPHSSSGNAQKDVEGTVTTSNKPVTADKSAAANKPAVNSAATPQTSPVAKDASHASANNASAVSSNSGSNVAPIVRKEKTHKTIANHATNDVAEHRTATTISADRSTSTKTKSNNQVVNKNEAASKNEVVAQEDASSENTNSSAINKAQADQQGNDRAALTPPANSENHAANSTTTNEQDRKANESNAEAQKPIGQDTASAVAKEQTSIKNEAKKSNATPVRYPETEQDTVRDTHFRVGVGGSYGFVASLPGDASSQSMAGILPLAGIDLDLADRFTVGLEAGYSKLSRITPADPIRRAPNGESNAAYIEIRSKIEERNAPFARVVGRYTIANLDETTLRLNGGVGTSYLSNVAPMVMAGIESDFATSHSTSLFATFGVAGYWTSSIHSSFQTTTDNATTVGVVHHEATETTLFTPALECVVGVRF